MYTLENDIIHVHCKRSFLVAMVARDFDIIIFFLSLFQLISFSFKFISIAKNWNGYRFVNFLLKCISCEKSWIYAKKIIFLPILGVPPPWIRPWAIRFLVTSHTSTKYIHSQISVHWKHVIIEQSGPGSAPVAYR
jgi:hypothetical protein